MGLVSEWEQKDIEDLKKDATLWVVLDTQDVSPPLVAFLLPLGAWATKEIGQWAILRIMDGLLRAVKGWKEKKEIQARLFGFCRNAEFVIGQKHPFTGNPWSVWGIRALEELLEKINGVFREKPQLISPEETGISERRVPSFSKHLVAIGGPVMTPFSRAIMGIKTPTSPSVLPYTFNLTPSSEVEDKIAALMKEGKPAEDFWTLLREWEVGIPDPNWNISFGKDPQRSKYIPELIEVKDGIRVLKDYGMIVKRNSVCERARRLGMKNLMLAGCHGVGTVAAATALGDIQILEEIFKSAGDGVFQAIIMTETKTERITAKPGIRQIIDIPDSVHLVEINPLSE